ncbi:MAG: thermonuclease family protein [Alphaproteobacteria bacterium]|nr:thermonuclease family protein [Alphaproteobacteria bacterium]
MRKRRLLDLLVLAGLVIMAAYGTSLLPGGELAGRAKVVDGDSLRLDGTEIRLYGIDAPEARQICTDRTGSPYSCGRRAARALRRLVAGGDITCVVETLDRYGRSVSLCKAGSANLNLEMVKAGWAVAYRSHSLDFTDAEDEARKAHRGLWQGLFDRPSVWRKTRASAADAAGNGLPDD